MLKSKRVMCIRGFKEFYVCHPVKLWLIAALLLISIFVVGSIFWREVFWDNFIWRYYVAPIVADVDRNSTGDISGDYNIVNTVTYGLILALSLFYILKFLKRYNIKIDKKFMFAIFPFIVSGSIARALADASLFREPLMYLFIAPVIYLFIGVFVIILLILGTFLERMLEKKDAVRILGCLYFTLGAIYVLIYFFQQDLFFRFMMHPVLFILIIAFSFVPIIFDYKNKEDIATNTTVFSIGLLFLSCSTYFTCHWLFIERWGNRINVNTYLTAGAYIFFIAFFSTFLVFIVAKLLRNKRPSVSVYASGISTMLFFAHFLDASATYFGIEYLAYSEKHVLPTYLIGAAGNAVIMFPLKFLIVALIIYLLDIRYKKEFENEQERLVGLVKIAVLILGIAPGIRDTVRMMMGV
ncbi:MAG: DUF63 family protein [Thermoplasmata archaeon]